VTSTKWEATPRVPPSWPRARELPIDRLVKCIGSAGYPLGKITGRRGNRLHRWRAADNTVGKLIDGLLRSDLILVDELGLWVAGFRCGVCALVGVSGVWLGVGHPPEPRGQLGDAFPTVSARQGKQLDVRVARFRAGLARTLLECERRPRLTAPAAAALDTPECTLCWRPRYSNPADISCRLGRSARR